MIFSYPREVVPFLLVKVLLDFKIPSQVQDGIYVCRHLVLPIGSNKMVGATFGLAVEKDPIEKGFSDGFREVFLVKKDEQGRCYHISFSTEFEISGAEWLLPSDIFDQRFRLLTAHEMAIFTDDSHITQLLHPSSYNMIHIKYKGGKFHGGYAL